MSSKKTRAPNGQTSRSRSYEGAWSMSVRRIAHFSESNDSLLAVCCRIRILSDGDRPERHDEDQRGGPRQRGILDQMRPTRAHVRRPLGVHSVVPVLAVSRRVRHCRELSAGLSDHRSRSRSDPLPARLFGTGSRPACSERLGRFTRRRSLTRISSGQVADAFRASRRGVRTMKSYRFSDPRLAVVSPP